MKSYLQWACMAVLFVAVIFSFYFLNKQAVIIKNQSILIEKISEDITNLSEETGRNYDDINNLTVDYNSTKSDIMLFLKSNRERLDALESTETVTKEENVNKITTLNDRITFILSQIEKLDKDKVTEQNFNSWVQKLELLVNNSLVELSKPANVPPMKPMPNTTQVVQNIALSNAEKEAIVKIIKGEVFKQFEQAGYGKFVGDRFILRKGFFGAEIAPEDESKYSLEK